MSTLDGITEPGTWVTPCPDVDVHPDGTVPPAVSLAARSQPATEGLREAARAVIDHRAGKHGIVAYSCGGRFDEHVDALAAALAAIEPAGDERT